MGMGGYGQGFGSGILQCAFDGLQWYIESSCSFQDIFHLLQAWVAMAEGGLRVEETAKELGSLEEAELTNLLRESCSWVAWMARPPKRA